MHGAVDPGPAPIDLLEESARAALERDDHELATLVRRLNLTEVMRRGIRLLATGELRKSLLLVELDVSVATLELRRLATDGGPERRVLAPLVVARIDALDGWAAVTLRHVVGTQPR